MITVMKLIASTALLHLELENGFRPRFMQFYGRLLSLSLQFNLINSMVIFENQRGCLVIITSAVGWPH